MGGLVTSSRADSTGRDCDVVLHAPDPDLQPMPHYGTLGPASDMAQIVLAGSIPDGRRISALPWLHLGAAMVGIFVALLVSSGRNYRALWKQPVHQLRQRQSSALLPVSLSDRDLDRRKPQEQAEILLERAIAHTDIVPAQTEAEIEARLDRWRGKLKWDAELGQLNCCSQLR
jgi:hypothetical protein